MIMQFKDYTYSKPSGRVQEGYFEMEIAIKNKSHG
jgi:hypothetical protein